MRLDEIIAQLGPQAATQQISHTGDTFAEITKVYHEMYAGPLSAFFETNWFYFTENGKMTFPRDARAVQAMASFLKVLESSGSSTQDEVAVLDNSETSLVWELARTAYTPQQGARTPPKAAVLPSWTDPFEARSRVQVVEALLSGDTLAKNPLTPPYTDADAHRVRQFDFWYTLGELCRRPDDQNLAGATEFHEKCLARLRSLLDGRENRDVLYSIAVIRVMTPRYASEDGPTIPQYVNETDPKCRFLVATKFITSETQADWGSTNAIRRFCKIAVHAHIDPGSCQQKPTPV
ncbi:hypothetical protein CC79DRAFT_1393885 [Sarocladium strictum]